MNKNLKESLNRYITNKFYTTEELEWDNKKYPKSHNLHLDANEGEHHVIQGVPHTDENADKVYKHIVNNIHKETGLSKRRVDDGFQNADGHHNIRHESDISGKPDKVHKSIEDYAKYHHKGDVAWIRPPHHGNKLYNI